MATAVAVAGLVIAAAGTAVSTRQGNRARADQIAANEKAEQSAQSSRGRQRNRAVAEAAKARARIQAEAATRLTVGGSSSATQQAAGSITTQLSSNLGFLQQQEQLESERFGFLSSANRARGRAATAGAIGGALSGAIQQF